MFQEVLLVFPELKSEQLRQLVELLYSGEVVGAGVREVHQLNQIFNTLGIAGISVEMVKEEKFEDDVFDEEQNDVAMDLSPVNRHPPVSTDHLLLAATSRRMNALNKISQTLQRPTTFPIKPLNSSGSSFDSRTFSSTSSDDQFSNNLLNRRNNSILNRTKKPKPLTNLPSLENSTNYLLKPKTPRTPLIASPDCKVSALDIDLKYAGRRQTTIILKSTIWY